MHKKKRKKKKERFHEFHRSLFNQDCSSNGANQRLNYKNPIGIQTNWSKNPVKCMHLIQSFQLKQEMTLSSCVPFFVGGTLHSSIQCNVISKISEFKVQKYPFMHTKGQF